MGCLLPNGLTMSVHLPYVYVVLYVLFMGACRSGTVCVGTGLADWMGGYVGQYPGRPEHKTDSSPASSAKFKKEWIYTSAPSICLHGVHRESFTLTIYLAV